MTDTHAPRRRETAWLGLGLALALMGSALAPGPASAAEGIILRGLVLVDDQAAIHREGLSGVSAIDVRAAEIPAADATRVLQSFLGKTIDSKLLDGIRQALQSYFQSIHQPFVSVVVPPQGVDSGVVQVVVLVSKLGKLSVTGNDWFGQDQYTDPLHVVPGGPINGAQLDADINWVNRNQYRHAAVVASPGQAVGTTDLTVRTQEDRPFSFTGGFDNTGTTATDLYRWNVGVDWGNAFWRGDDLNYRFTASPDLHLLQQHVLSYSTDLPWRDGLTIVADYATSNTPSEVLVGNSGVSAGASLRYTKTLGGPSWLTHHLVLGYDFKSSNNNILFGGTSVFAATSEVDQFQLEYGGQAPDPFGNTGLDIILVGSPGGLTPLNNDATFALQVPGAKARYFYARATADRLTYLPEGFSWDLRGTVQLSASTLLPSEQIVFGGYSSVRGFAEQGATRDNGFLVETELRAPTLKLGLPSGLGFETLGDGLTPFLFLDVGGGWNHREGVDIGSWIEMSSIGPGLSYQMGQAASVRFTWGLPLQHNGPEIPRLGPQFALQLTL